MRSPPHTSASRGAKLGIRLGNLVVVEDTASVVRPQPATVGAGTEALAPPVACHHWPDHETDGRYVAEAAAISSAGTVLSQPPSMTTPSMG